MKGFLIRPFTKWIARSVRRDSRNAVSDQEAILRRLTQQAGQTVFGKDHRFGDVVEYADYQQAVPIRDYESLKSYFDRIAAGESNVLWPGRPIYLAKTSGTTSGVKYIPITKASLPNHLDTARNALFNYASKGTRTRLFDGKVMFLSGSPALHYTGGIKTGRLSGIVNHEIPTWLQGNQLPTMDTNCIDDWESKVDKIVAETSSADLRLISGIPPWVQMYFERLLDFTATKCVKEVFPNLQVFMHGGVNYEPYAKSLDQLIGGGIDTLETYPASEGFIAFQDDLSVQGLLLNTNSGIFFEFVPLETYFSDRPQRLRLADVRTQTDYAVVINSNAGLWGYSLGDTIRFTSLDPYRIEVSGRVKHFISAFGEHVIAKEVEEAMLHASTKHRFSVKEFTVAPQVNPPEGGLPYHEWLVEFENEPPHPDLIASDMDLDLRRQNVYYDDLIKGNILRPLVLRKVKKDGFRLFMKSLGKLGGQNKVPRLSNDRKIADGLYREGLLTH